jgi:hypothetical protein
MAFVARCSFCHLILREVPEHRLGSSVDCPRCANSFTLAPATDAVAVASRGAHVDPAEAPEPAIAAAEGPSSPPQTALSDLPPIKPALPDSRVEAETSVLGKPEAEEPPPPPSPAPRFTNYPGLAAFLLGCFAFLAGGLLSTGLATMALGLFGLLLGVLGLFFAWLIPTRRVLPAAGIAVSLPALLLPLVWPGLLGFLPLGAPARPTNRGGDAAMSLSGVGGLRRSTEGETLWVDASHDALHHGDVRLRVTSAVVGQASFEPVQGKAPPGDRCLVVGLRVSNAGIMRKLTYKGWAGGDPEPPVLRDDKGKTYAPKAFGAGWVVKGQAPSATIPPGKPHNDVLVFEAPPPGVGYLRLELPAAAVGSEGRLRMEIPRQMIVFH